MICVKCKKEIPENSLFCNYCGKKQKAVNSGKHNRSHGTGTIKHDKRYKNKWLAYTIAEQGIIPYIQHNGM